MATQRTYLAIDLKSFYASVECVDRHLDPLTTNLVVADASRTEKTICLAVSPSLKAYKIPGRARLFEAVQRVKEVNAQRLQTAIRQKKAVRGEDGKYHFSSTSFDANALNADPALGLSYIVAPPRMQRYLDVSTQIYKTYLKYVSPADIYPYSIDEVFIDVTGYLPYYHMSAHELAMTMVREVLYNTGITATAGIGTNLYLAKLAMDIVAKHIPADKDNTLLCELAAHPDFPRLMADLEIYVNGTALKQAQGANAIVDTMSATVIKKHNPGMSDTQLRQLITAHIDEDEFCRYVIQRDINGIALALRETHKDDFFSVPEDNPLKEMLETAGEIVSQDSDTEQAYLAFICKRLKLNFRKLSVEERKWLKKIAEKSDLLKNPKPQRGRR